MRKPIGKIEDAGQVVEGGRIDRYWEQEEIKLSPEYYTGSDRLFKAKWLYDPELALQHFGLRSIEFGNWMNQEDRANFLYASMLGLHQLALIFGVKDSQIGLGGKLSIALGARGQGGAAGHYESLPYSVINITKPHGRMGVLAHEFAHALDNIISHYTKSKQTFVSGGRTSRKGFNEQIAQNGNYFEKQFEEFFNLLYFDERGNKTDFHQSLNQKDEYWNRRNEVFARTFEVYISNKQKKRQHHNIFLAPESFTKEYPSLALIEGGVSRIIGNIVSKGFSVMASNGGALNGLDLPTIGYMGFRKTLKVNASLDDTLQNMKRIALRDRYQVKELAASLEGETVAATAHNVWDFIRENLTYQLDTEGIEELRTPARTLNDLIFDCDDATILVSSILLNLKMGHEYRITSYKERGKFTHIYPVAFDVEGNEFVIDTVPEIPYFNYEEQPIIDLKTVKMELHELSGISETAALTEAKQELLSELKQPFSLGGLDERTELSLAGTFLSGLEEVQSEEEADIVIATKDDALRLVENGFLAEVLKAKESLIKEQTRPTLLSQTINVASELNLVNTLMEVWEDTDLRIEQIERAIAAGSIFSNFYMAIRIGLEELETEAQSLNGMEDDEDEPIYLARTGRVDLMDILRDGDDPRREALNGFFKKITKKIGGAVKTVGKKISTTVKSAGQGLKKAALAVVRYNPASVLVRNAILLVLKLNLFNIASNVIYGYLNRNQAEAKNMNLSEWSKVVNAKDQLVKFFTTIGGKSDNFRASIVKGKAASKSGVHLSGLGEAATSTAAASGFIAFAKKILASINPAQLFKKLTAKINSNLTSNQEVTETIEQPQIQYMQTPDYAPIDFGQPLDFAASEPKGSPKTDTLNLVSQSSANPAVVRRGNAAQGSSFLQRVKAKVGNIWHAHRKTILLSGGAILFAIIFLLVWKRRKKKKSNQLKGIKAARTRARNRKLQLKGVAASTASRSTAAKSRRSAAPKSLGRGNTTVVRTPTKGRGKTRVYQQSSKNRLSLMHAKAKQLQKKHPKTKYSKLLSMAAKEI